jgi:DNA invertase Pin-like site-specific DNA recombinase
MKVVSYIRVSGKGQVDKDGPERQRADIDIFCTVKELDIVCEYFEPGVSGTTDGLDRPKFRQLIDEVQNYRRNGIKIEAIVVERMDRLARDLMVSEILLQECRKRKLKVFAVDQGELIDMAADNADDPTRVLIRQVLGALSQWEKSSLVKKLRVARERTGRLGGKTPFGAKLGEAETLKFMMAMREQGASWRHIATELNAGGLRNREGRYWSHARVSQIVTRVKSKSQNVSDSVRAV